MAVFVQRIALSLTSNGSSSGSFTVSSVNGLGIGALCYVQSDEEPGIEGEVRSVDTETSTVTLCIPFKRQTAVDLSAYLTADNAVFVQREGLASELIEVAGGGAVDSVNGQTGIVVLDETDVGADAAGAAAAAVAAHAGTGGAAHAAANSGANGFMTSSDFSKLAALPSKPGSDGTFSLLVSSGVASYTTSSASGAAGSSGAVQYNDANALAGDATELFWDKTAKKLRVGAVSSLAAKVDVDAGTLANSTYALRVKGVLPNTTAYNEAFQFLVTSAGTGATNNGCRGGLVYLGPGYTGAADVDGVVVACEAVSSTISTDPLVGSLLDCGASAVFAETYGDSSNGVNMGSHNWAARGKINIGSRNFAGFPGFAENGFVQNGTSIAQVSSVSLAKNSSSTTERHIGGVNSAAGGDVNIGNVSGIGLTRARIEAYTGSAAHVFDNGSSDQPIFRALNNGSQVAVMYGGGQMQISGLSTAISTKTSSYSLTSLDSTILGDASGGALNVTLPAAANAPGWKYTVKKIDSSINAVTIAADGAETIDGASTKTLLTQWSFCTVQSNGSAWFVVGAG